MKSLLFEFEDVSWFPAVIREGMTDFLRFVLTKGNLYQPIIPLLQAALQQTNANRIIDLCSGAGGAIEQVQHGLKKLHLDKPVVVTDKFPNISAYKLLQAKTKGAISYITQPVDALQVPPELTGFRTIFSGFHHFQPAMAKAVLQDAVSAKQGIAIFDGGDKSIVFIITILLLQPIAFILLTPFIKPFRWSRLLFTYLLPLIPFCTVWDGIVSVSRLYKPEQMLALTRELNKNYIWKAGKVKNRFGMSIAYLIGCPNEEKNS